MKQHYQGLGHIAVYTADMDASIAFYEKIGGSLHLRAPACSPEQRRELPLWSSAASWWSCRRPCAVGSAAPSSPSM